MRVGLWEFLNSHSGGDEDSSLWDIMPCCLPSSVSSLDNLPVIEFQQLLIEVYIIYKITYRI